MSCWVILYRLVKNDVYPCLHSDFTLVRDLRCTMTRLTVNAGLPQVASENCRILGAITHILQQYYIRRVIAVAFSDDLVALIV